MTSSTLRLSARPRAHTLAVSLAALALGAGAAHANMGLIAFGAQAAARQGTFEAGGIAWTCNGELCGGEGPEDRTLWPALCAALVRETGPVVAFGSLAQRFDGGELERCNREGAQPSAPATPPPAPAPTPAPAVQPAVAAAPSAAVNLELCNGHDDDGDGEVDEGVRLTVWTDRDRDLYGDPGSRREICPHELAPGWVVDDSDCDDGDRRRNPARDNCPAPPPAR